MNILIPDSWLREFLKTEATAKQIKEYLSLCGPSIERMHEKDKDTVYDIEITGNRPDAMSVVGIAREAAAILPRFGIPATLMDDPYTKTSKPPEGGMDLLSPRVDSALCPRFTAIVIDNITISESPDWLKQWLTKADIRSINTVVDISNYLMRAYGQPCHTFDFGKIKKANGKAVMNLRASKKGETVQTLDGKTHELPGGDIVIEDCEGDLIDLCGIMGGYTSQIDDETKEVLLFVQTYDPSHIRKTSMALAHRTEASGLFEKGLDSELVLPTIVKGIELFKTLTNGVVKSKLYDIYPHPYKPVSVSVTTEKMTTYMGLLPEKKTIKTMLEPLGFGVTQTKNVLTVRVPSWRRDVTIDVDVIEEIARLYGYHNLPTKLPDTEPPVIFEDPLLLFELELKKRLRDWGYTETYTYSMISKKLMDTYNLDKTRAYTITNPLSQEWVYMRPTLLPSMLEAVKYNLSYETDLRLFELSMVYEHNANTLPKERPMLVVCRTGACFYELKGLAEALCSAFHIPLEEHINHIPSYMHPSRSLSLDIYGQVGELHPAFGKTIGITDRVTILLLDVQKLLDHRATTGTYTEIPKYPASVEDLALTVPDKTLVGPLMADIKAIDPLIHRVTLLDSYKDTRTFHIVYQSTTGNLTSEMTKPIREKILTMLAKKHQALLRSV